MLCHSNFREEQQRIAIAKQQRLGAAAAAAARGMGRGIATSLANRASATSLAVRAGKGVTIGMTKGNAQGLARGAIIRGKGAPGRIAVAGPRPSFQYREGAFICDLCKKSFSDGNDMVAHWKSHVKQQHLQKKGAPAAAAKPAPVAGPSKGRGRPPVKSGAAAKNHVTSRGRPITGYVFNLTVWAEIHQALLSQFSLLVKFFNRKVPAKIQDSRVLVLVNLTPDGQTKITKFFKIEYQPLEYRTF